MTIYLLSLVFIKSASCQHIFYIEKIRGGFALINGGTDDGIQQGQDFYVMRRAGIHLVDLGIARALRVEDNRAAVRLISKNESKKLRPGDMVFESERDLRFYKSGYGPEGFQGIYWGTDIRILEDMEDLYHTGISCHGMEFYNKLIEISSIGEVDFDDIEYSFVDGKFSGVVLNTNGLVNLSKLKTACLNTFGPMNRSDKKLKLFYWKRHKAIILLKYDESTGGVSLMIASREINNHLTVAQAPLKE